MTEQKASGTAPYLIIKILGARTDGTEFVAATHIRVDIPTELSLSVAKMHLIQVVAKEMRRYAAKEALKNIGLK